MDWLGDWGGLLDCLKFLVELLINPYAAFVMNSKLSFLLVKFFPSEKQKSNQNKKSTSHNKRDAFINRFYNARNTNEEKKKNKMIASNMTDDIRQL